MPTKPKIIRSSLFSKTLQSSILKKRALHVLIAANLPYLPRSDKKTLSKSVTKFEPSRALYGGTIGDELIVTLLNQLQKFHAANGNIRLNAALEFDPPQAQRLVKLAQKLFPRASCAIVKDTFEKDRFLIIDSI